MASSTMVPRPQESSRKMTFGTTKTKVPAIKEGTYIKAGLNALADHGNWDPGGDQ